MRFLKTNLLDLKIKTVYKFILENIEIYEDDFI
jgi:hypothetical protein